MGRAVTVDEAALRAALAFLAGQAVTSYDADAALSQVSEHAARTFGALGAGVMLLDEAGRLQFVTANDELVGQVDLMQATMAEGPCLVASRGPEVVISPDLRTDDRWPRFSAVAAEAGLRAVACFPLLFEDHCWGTFNLFYGEAVEYPSEVLEAGRVLGAVAAALLHNAREYERVARLADQLHQALRTRLVIEQAKGMIAAEQQIHPDEAFERLRSRAREQQRKIHELARAVLTGEARIQ